MKATGIVRRIDDLGRVVIPKEIRRTLRIREGDPLEIFTDREGEIILKKYSPIGELSAFAAQYADSLAQTSERLVCICDMDQIVAASGSGKKDFQEKFITKALEKALEGRRDIFASQGDKGFIKITEEHSGYSQEVISPILAEEMSLRRDPFRGRRQKKMNDTEMKLAACGAGFLGRQMEQ